LKKVFLLTVALAVALLAPSRASAVSVGNAALTVGVTTLAGGILGASTLPFYSDSGAHTKNIYYGAAIGAVVGVLLAAYAGVQEGPDDDEEAFRRKFEDEPALASDWSLRAKLTPEPISAGIGNASGVVTPLFASSVSIWNF